MDYFVYEQKKKVSQIKLYNFHNWSYPEMYKKTHTKLKNNLKQLMW